MTKAHPKKWSPVLGKDVRPTKKLNPPRQLELFRMVSDEKYTNAFAFYESIPRFIVARGKSKTVCRNPDGTAAPVNRQFSYSNREFRLKLEPAYIEQKDGSDKAKFPGVREEIVEFVLMKLAIENAVFIQGQAGDSQSFTLITSLYKIYDALKSR